MGDAFAFLSRPDASRTPNLGPGILDSMSGRPAIFMIAHSVGECKSAVKYLRIQDTGCRIGRKCSIGLTPLRDRSACSIGYALQKRQDRGETPLPQKIMKYENGTAGLPAEACRSLAKAGDAHGTRNARSQIGPTSINHGGTIVATGVTTLQKRRVGRRAVEK